MPIKQNESPRSSSKPGREGTRLLQTPGSRSYRAQPGNCSRASRTIINGNGNSNGNGSGDATAREHENENVFFQDTVIEFGTPHEVLFVLDRPLQFADRVLVESNDGSLHAEAFVVAVQYHLERTAVAVRFLKHVPNWIVKS